MKSSWTDQILMTLDKTVRWNSAYAEYLPVRKSANALRELEPAAPTRRMINSVPRGTLDGYWARTLPCSTANRRPGLPKAGNSPCKVVTTNCTGWLETVAIRRARR